jgi:hypothetical protein
VGVDDLAFPVLGRTQRGNVFVWPSAATLTLNTAVGLRNGFYTDLELVDSGGRCFRVASARKLEGVGRFAGYNVFLNQRIRTELQLEDKHRQATVDEVRDMILEYFRRSDGWTSREDFLSVRNEVQSSTTIGELLSRLATAAFPPHAQT